MKRADSYTINLTHGWTDDLRNVNVRVHAVKSKECNDCSAFWKIVHGLDNIWAIVTNFTAHAAEMVVVIRSQLLFFKKHIFSVAHINSDTSRFFLSNCLFMWRFFCCLLHLHYDEVLKEKRSRSVGLSKWILDIYIGRVQLSWICRH